MFCYLFIAAVLGTASAVDIDKCGLDCDVSLLQVALQHEETANTTQVSENLESVGFEKNMVAARSLVAAWRLARGDESTVVPLATKVTNKLNEEVTTDNKGVLKKSLAAGVAGSLAVVISGGTSEQVSAAMLGGATEIINGIAGMVNPMLGLVVTVAMGMMQGLFMRTTSNPTQLLYDAIITSVKNLIQENNVQQQIKAMKNDILAVTEELSWVPDLVEAASNDVMKSYFLTVQHDLATKARLAFGDCFDDLSSKSCRSWREAGTLDLSFDYAQLHLSVLSSLYAVEASEEFHALLKAKVTSVATKYKCLLQDAVSSYKAANNGDGRFEIQQNGYISTYGGSSKKGYKKKCQWVVKIKDKKFPTGKDWTLNEEDVITLDRREKKKKDEKRNKQQCADAVRDNKDRMLSEYLAEWNAEFKAQFEDPVDALFDGYLTGSDASDPCTSSGMTSL